MAILYQANRFSRNQIQQAAKIQIQEIDQGFLSSLGEKALGLIFAHIAESRWGIIVLATDEITGKVIGYVLGTISAGKLYRDFFLKKLPAALFYILPKILTPQRVIKAFETLLYPQQNQRENIPKAELLDLAVSGSYHGHGVAQGLFRAFEKECRDRGVSEFKIPTGELLERAHRFYEKMGAVRSGVFELHSGQKTFIYVYKIR